MVTGCCRSWWLCFHEGIRNWLLFIYLFSAVLFELRPTHFKNCFDVTPRKYAQATFNYVGVSFHGNRVVWQSWACLFYTSVINKLRASLMVIIPGDE